MEDKTEFIVDKHFKSLMFYNTAFRNVGLFTSIAFAVMAFSRTHKNKDNFALYGRIMVLGILLIAVALNISLYNTLNQDMKKDPERQKVLASWMYISISMMSIHGVLIAMNIYKIALLY